MAQSLGAVAAGARAALLRQRTMTAARDPNFFPAASHGRKVFPFQSLFSSITPFCKRTNGCVFHGVSLANEINMGRYLSTSAGAAASYMLVEKPRPTQYQTEICNEATNVKPGVEKRSTKGIIFITTLLIVFPIVHTKYELHKYYSEYDHYYRNGWDLYHYDKRKNTYLS